MFDCATFCSHLEDLKAPRDESLYGEVVSLIGRQFPESWPRKIGEDDSVQSRLSSGFEDDSLITHVWPIISALSNPESDFGRAMTTHWNCLVDGDHTTVWEDLQRGDVSHSCLPKTSGWHDTFKTDVSELKVLTKIIRSYTTSRRETGQRYKDTVAQYVDAFTHHNYLRDARKMVSERLPAVKAARQNQRDKEEAAETTQRSALEQVKYHW